MLDLVSITNRISHTCFRLVPTSVTLTDFEWRNNPYFRYFIESDVRHVSFWTNVCVRVAAVNQNSVYVVATVKLHCGRSQNHQSRWLAY